MNALTKAGYWLAAPVLLAALTACGQVRRYEPLANIAGRTLTESPCGHAGAADVGKASRAFDGRTYATVPNAPRLNPTRALTLEAWVEPTRSMNFSDYVPVIAKSSPAASEPYVQYALYLKDNAKSEVPRSLIFVLALDGNRRTLLVTNAGWQYGKWNQVAATYDGTLMRVFRNGIQIGSVRYSGTISTYDTPVYIAAGENSPFSPYHFLGRLAEIAVYPSAVSPRRICRHYLASAHPQRYRRAVLRDHPAAYWTFGAPTSGRVQDLSGHGYVGGIAG